MVQGKAPDPHLDTLALLMAAAMAGKSCRDLEEDCGEGGGRGVRGGAEG